MSVAQETRAQLEVSESFFTLFSALNSCGYDAGLAESLPLRQAVVSDLMAITQQSQNAANSRDAICQFWREHKGANGENDVSQYVSLALELSNPPAFTSEIPEGDMPPDAAYVLGILPLLRKYYQAAGIHQLWEKHQGAYDSLVTQLHDPVSTLINQTDIFLKLPFATYPGQRFAVYLEPLLSPGQIEARNYGNNYYVVYSPDKQGKIPHNEIRHTYLHFVLDPLAASHGTSLKRLEPILLDIRFAPLSRAFKQDIALMVNECLIRAIEARLTIPKSNERAREAYVEHSMEQGFVLTRYFYDALANFEKSSGGMKTVYGDLLHGLDLDRERKRAREVTFAEQADPEVISPAKAVLQAGLLNQAEQKFASGDIDGAQKLASEILQHNHGGDEPGRAVFLLARIATLQGKMEEARFDFEQAVQSARDPRTLAWSHIYLGRMNDLQENRDAALQHYRAALAAGDPAADTRTAAEKGIEAPYQPAAKPKQE
jgi:tetratricopeptide (TPR) repeat protein